MKNQKQRELPLQFSEKVRSRPISNLTFVCGYTKGGFTLRSKTKETLKLSNLIGRQQNFGPKKSTLGSGSKVILKVI